MKKRILLVVLTTLVIVSVFAQSTDNASRLVGTWINNVSNARWVFNANGTLAIGNQTHRYGATETFLAIKYARSAIGAVTVFEYSFSSDGRTLILKPIEGSGVWLTRQ